MWTGFLPALFLSLKEEMLSLEGIKKWIFPDKNLWNNYYY